MRIFHPLFLVVTTLGPSVCLAQTKCPWMNAASASGILGGSVTVTTSISSTGDGVCEFSRQNGTTIHRLTISVQLMADIPKEFPRYLQKCPPNSSSIPAIGNQAITCSVENNQDEYAEFVIGRVRDQAFVIGVSSTAKKDPSMTQTMRRKKANAAAQSVAGALF
jgi:hypothetical protein